MLDIAVSTNRASSSLLTSRPEVLSILSSVGRDTPRSCAVFVFVCFIPSYYLLISLVALFLKQSGVVPCTPSCCSTSILGLALHIRNRGTSS